MLMENAVGLRLGGSDVVSREKAIGFPLGQGWWMNIHLRMMGQVIAVSKKELAQLDDARLNDRESTRGKITMQLTFVNDDQDEIVSLLLIRSD